MSVTAELFSRWKEARGFPSDRAALHALGVSHGAAVHWRAGRNADVHIIEKMAADLGDDPFTTVARAMAEGAKGPDAKTWNRFAKRLGAAAVVVLAVALPYQGTRAESVQAEQQAAIYIMRSWARRLAALIAKLGRRPGVGHASPLLA